MPIAKSIFRIDATVSTTMTTDILKAEQGRKEKYIVPALHQKRKNFVVIHDINQTVHHVSKFYHGNKVACTFVGALSS